jgi:hypothetical protein
MSEQESEKPYLRKLSLVNRFANLLISPSEAMEDISLAPDFAGVGIIIILEIVLSIMATVLVFQKLQFVGPSANAIISVVTGALVFAIALGVAIFLLRWLVKSLLVKAACDSGSSWSFSAAASVTGYAYLADTIVGTIGLIASWFLIPSVVIDTTNLSQALITMTQYQAQINWLKLIFTLPMSIIGVVWKSYLGGLGAHFGTKSRCSRGTGIAVFLVLGIIGLVINFVL